MPKCQCAGNACNCNITAGEGLVVTGTGNASAPFAISLASPYVPVTVAAAGPIDLTNLNSGSVAVLNMSANVTGLTLPTTAGSRIDIILRHVVAGTQVSWPTIAWPGGTAPVQATAANRYDWISLRNVGGAWVGAPLALNAF